MSDSIESSKNIRYGEVVSLPIAGPMRLGSGLVAAFLLMALPTGIAWYWTFCEMWLRWFPAWANSELSWSARLTSGESYYSHALLVPVVTVYLFWQRLHDDTSGYHRSTSAACMAWAAMVMVLILHVACTYLRVAFISGFSFVGFLLAFLVWWGGWSALRRYGSLVLLLLFMIPLPMHWIHEVGFALKMLAGQVGLFLVDALGFPVVLDGSYVHVLAYVDDSPRTLQLGQVCGGLRSAMSLCWIASVYLTMATSGAIGRTLILILVLPVAILCNALRIAFLIFLTYAFDVTAAAEDGWPHQLSGIVVFALAMMTLIGLDYLFAKLIRPARKTSVTVKHVPHYSTRLAGVHGWGMVCRWPTVVVSMVALMCVACAENDKQPVATSFATHALSDTFNDGEMAFLATEVALPASTLAMLRTTDFTFKRYRIPQASTQVDALVVFSGRHRESIHPPNICIAGSGQEIITQRDVVIDAQEGLSVVFRELITQRDGAMACHLFTYKYGDHYTANFTQQQWGVLTQRILGAPSGGALIRFSVPPVYSQASDACRLVHVAAMNLMPEIEKALP